MKCLVCGYEINVDDKQCSLCKVDVAEAEEVFRNTYIGAVKELSDAFVELLKAVNNFLEPLNRFISKGGKMEEGKKISVSQEKKYVSEGWTVIERSECGRYIYVVKK
jgi:hypothetical protein